MPLFSRLPSKPAQTNNCADQRQSRDQRPNPPRSGLHAQIFRQQGRCKKTNAVELQDETALFPILCSAPRSPSGDDCYPHSENKDGQGEIKISEIEHKELVCTI